MASLNKPRITLNIWQRRNLLRFVYLLKTHGIKCSCDTCIFCALRVEPILRQFKPLRGLVALRFTNRSAWRRIANSAIKGENQ